MDKRLQVYDKLRPAVTDTLANMSLVTLAWRAQQAEYKRRAEKERYLENALTSIAEEAYRLRRAAQNIVSTSGESEENHQRRELRAIADQLQKALAQLDVTIVVPENKHYTPELMEMFENIAQLPKPGISEPFVAEVVAPAIMYRDAVVRMGKAIIAVPVKEEENP